MKKKYKECSYCGMLYNIYDENCPYCYSRDSFVLKVKVSNNEDKIGNFIHVKDSTEDKKNITRGIITRRPHSLEEQNNNNEFDF